MAALCGTWVEDRLVEAVLAMLVLNALCLGAEAMPVLDSNFAGDRAYRDTVADVWGPPFTVEANFGATWAPHLEAGRGRSARKRSVSLRPLSGRRDAGLAPE
jgi:hypothetical protein